MLLMFIYIHSHCVMEDTNDRGSHTINQSVWKKFMLNTLICSVVNTEILMIQILKLVCDRLTLLYLHQLWQYSRMTNTEYYGMSVSHIPSNALQVLITLTGPTSCYLISGDYATLGSLTHIERRWRPRLMNHRRESLELSMCYEWCGHCSHSQWDMSQLVSLWDMSQLVLLSAFKYWTKLG